MGQKPTRRKSDLNSPILSRPWLGGQGELAAFKLGVSYFRVVGVFTKKVKPPPTVVPAPFASVVAIVRPSAP
jgi:hypothetical protein